MRVLLDEDVPKPLLPALQRVLAGHDVVHVDDLHWKSKKDVNLLADAAGRGFDAIVTNDSKQLDDAEECRAIRDSGLHHIRYRQQTGRGEGGGLNGLALAMGAILAAMRQIVRDLESADGQRLVLIHEIRNERRHDLIDPKLEPPAYWPSRPSRSRKGARRGR
jgi:hypothetical protein